VQLRIDVLKRLYALTDALVRVARPEDIYTEALSCLEALLGTNRASILLFDRDGVMRFVAWRGLSHAYRAAVEGHTPWARDERHARPIVVNDVSDAPSLQAYSDLFQSERIAALAFVPLVVGEQLIGKFMLYYEEPRSFGPDELALAMSVAGHIASAVARDRALADTDRTTHRLALQLDVTRVLADATQVDDAVTRCLEAICDGMGWRVGQLWTVDRERDCLKWRGVWQDPTRYAPAFEALSRVTTFDRGIGLPGRVLANNRPAWVEDVTSDDSFPRASVAAAEGLRGALAFPVRIDDRVVGVMEFFSGQIESPDDELLAVLVALGNQIGQFVRRKRAEVERERMREEALSAAREAQEAVRVRDDFLSIAGHELKTPLTALDLHLFTLDRLTRGPLEPEKVRKKIEVTRRQAQRLNTLINRLLDVSRISAGRLALELEDIDLAVVVRDVVARFDEEAGRAHTPVDVDLTGTQPRPGRWDRMRIEQVVTNLVSNAIKYGDGKPICIVTRALDDRVQLIVEDHGIGIAPEHQARIFDRFERAVSLHNYGGLGLGLWIVRQIVEAHSGTIALDSTLGSGSCFTVELPYASSAVEPASGETDGGTG